MSVLTPDVGRALAASWVCYAADSVGRPSGLAGKPVRALPWIAELTGSLATGDYDFARGGHFTAGFQSAKSPVELGFQIHMCVYQ